MTTSPEDETRRYSRRGFLRRAGAGAGAAALSGGVGAGVAPRAAAARSATVETSPTTFGRMFPNLRPFAAATDDVKAALVDLGKPGELLDAADDLDKGPILLITDLSLSANNRNNQVAPEAGCDHVVRGATEEEALRNAAEHAKEHGIGEVTPELMEKVKAAMHDE
jgi:predicted small metal-binding protein